MLQSFHYLTATCDVFDNVNAIMQADRDLYDGAHLDEIYTVFKNRGFFYDHEKSGSISSNETWSNYIHVTGDVSVSSGVTLTIEPNTFLFFDANKYLSVYGTLSAEGTSTEPINFTSSSSSSWYGLKLYSSNCTLDYCQIQNASRGIYIYNSTPSIEHSYLHDNTYGCYINYLADPVFYYNTFRDNSYGIKCYNSDAHFGEPHTPGEESPNPGYNDIIDNNYGLFATQNSDVFLGMDVATQALGGYNSLDTNSTVDILATSSSDVSAEHNWWGTDGSDNYKDGTSSIITYNPLEDDPEGGSSLAKISANADDEDKFNPDDVDENNPEELLRLARYNKNLGRYKEALDVAEEIIVNYPATNYAVKAMLQIYSISRRSDIVNIEEYCLDNINSKENSYQVKLISNEILVSKYMLDRKNSLAEIRCNDILANYQYEESEKYALFNLFLMANQDAGKSDEAESYKSELENKYPNDPLTLDAKSLSGEEVDWSLTKESIKGSDGLALKPLLPKEFALYPAYPNPFNPSTTISFDFPVSSKINLEIYNVQGQKVWESPLNNSEFSAGNHSIVWRGVTTNGSSLPSGIYFVHFRGGKYHSSQKLLLIK